MSRTDAPEPPAAGRWATGADAASLLQPLRGIPRRDSDFLLTSADAQRQFGVPAGMLDALRDAGLSRRDGDSVDRYAQCDLHYVGVRCGTASEYLWAIRLWRRSLEAYQRRARTDLRIAYLPQLPDAPDGLPGSVVLSDGLPRATVLRSNEAAGEVAATMHSSWPEVPEAVAAVLRDAAALELCVLPDHARGDTALAQRLGVADCWTTAMLIVEGCHDAGFEARVVEGFIAAIPYSTVHMWAEVLLDGVWTPVDPVMISTLRRFAGLDPLAWPVHRSLGPLLAPVLVTPTPVKLLAHAGEWVPATFMTRRVERGADAP